MQIRKIKSVIALTLVGAMLLSLCGCAGTPAGTNTTSSVSTTAATASIPASDPMTELYEDAKDSFKAISDAISQKSEKSIVAEADKFLESLKTLRSESESDFAATRSELEKINRLDLMDRQQAYEDHITDSLNKAEKAVNDLKNTETRQQGLSVIRELFEEKQEDDVVTLGNAYNNIKTSVKSTSTGTVAEFSEPTDNDLKIENEVVINDDIKKICDDLGTAKGVYEFVKNAIGYEPYYRSKKGAIATFEQASGNDVDQASLLIGMLRYLGIPARYVQGKVIITTEQAIAITGASDAENAGALLAAQYKPVSMYTISGKLVGFVMEQVWVEAYVDYTDYRASGNKSGDPVWVSLDPSFKNLNVEKITVDNDNTSEDAVRRTTAMQKYDPDYAPDDQTIVYSRPIAIESDLYLPVSLPYTVDSVSKTFSSIPDGMRDRISVSVAWDSLVNLPISELYDKSVVVSFEPYTDDDRSLIESYGGIDKIPAYLIYLVPAVTVGDKMYKGKTPLTPGSTQNMKIVLTNSSGSNPISDRITVGSVYAINIDTQIITTQDIKRSEERVNAVKESVNDINIYSGETLGPILDFAGKWYFQNCDSYAAIASAALDIKRIRQTAIAVTGYRMGSESMFGYTKRLLEGDFIVDVDYNSATCISYSGDTEAEKKYTMLTGMMESSFEGELWEDILGEVEDNPFGISTVSVFCMARAAGVQPEFLTSSNAADLDNMDISDGAKKGIRNYLNAGRVVVVMPQDLTIGDWTGTAYMAFDPSDGSAVYMISGGLAGGSTSEPILLRAGIGKFASKPQKEKIVQVCFSINMLIYYINEVQALMELTGDIAAIANVSCTPAGVTSIVKTLCDAKSLGDAIALYLNNLDKLCTYYVQGETDEAAMDMLVFTLSNLINMLASSAWSAILDAIPAVKIAKTGYEIAAGDVLTIVNMILDSEGLKIREKAITFVAQASGLSDKESAEWFASIEMALLP